jgi:hypothetical protein
MREIKETTDKSTVRIFPNLKGMSLTRRIKG